MNRRVLIDGYQPTRSGETGRLISEDRRSNAGGPMAQRPTSGPAPTQRLPKTTSSVSVPKK